MPLLTRAAVRTDEGAPGSWLAINDGNGPDLSTYVPYGGVGLSTDRTDAARGSIA